MKKLLFSVLVFVLTNQVFAQIDTTIWFPLQIGNLWQYSYDISISETYYLNAEVVNDTIIADKKFFKMKIGNDFVFYRLENNERVWEYSTYTNQEFIRYDFVSSDKTVWHLDSIKGQYGVYETFSQYIRIFGDTLISKIFVSAYIDTTYNPPDTSWGPVVDGLANIVTKGLGVTEYGGGFNICRFTGAIINGQEIGNITSAKETLAQTSLFKLNQNYPNPFNPITNISYSIPNESNVEIIVFNYLGQKIKTLINGVKKRGSYKIQFNGNDLPSGIYFYQIKAGNFNKVKKMILLK